jgi:hypothetical protein
MPELHETLMGRKLIEGTLPEIARQLERIADALEKRNTPDQVASAFKAYANSNADDHDIVKQIRDIWQK